MSTTRMRRRSPSRENRYRRPSSASGVDVATYFFDSSAIDKRYVQEAGTASVRRVTRLGRPEPIYLTRITTVEVTAAVARRKRGGSLTAPRARSIVTRLRSHVAGRYLI